MAQFIPFPNVTIVNSNNPNITLGVIHHRYENLLQGCWRVAEEYRTKESSRDKFYIVSDGVTHLNSNGQKVLI